MSSISFRILFFYLIIYYFIPLFLGLFFNFSYLDFLNGEPNYLAVIPFLLVFIFLVLILSTHAYKFKNLDFLSVVFYRQDYVHLVASLVLLAFSIYYFFKFGLQFRHRGRAITDSSQIITLMIFLKIYFQGFIIFMISRAVRGVQITHLGGLTLFILFLGFVFSIEGAFDFLKIVILFALFLYYLLGINFFIARGKTFLPYRIVTCLVALVAGLGILFVGVANKIGISLTIERFTNFSFAELLILPLKRLSYHLYSLAYHLKYSVWDLDLQMNSVLGMIHNWLFRFSSLVGVNVEKIEILSVNRLNSLRIYEVSPGLRNGVSPGMLGAVFFIPYFPLSFILWTLFIVLVLKLFDDIFEGHNKLSFLTTMFLLTYFQAIVDSSLEILNPIGKPAMYLGSLVLVWMGRLRQEVR